MSDSRGQQQPSQQIKGRGFASISNLIPPTKVYDVVPPVSNGSSENRQSADNYNGQSSAQSDVQGNPGARMSQNFPLYRGPKFDPHIDEDEGSTNLAIMAMDKHELDIINEVIYDSEFFQQAGNSFYIILCKPSVS